MQSSYSDSDLTQMEFPAGKLKITMTSILNALMEKVGNIKNKFGNFGRQVKTKKNSNQKFGSNQDMT